MLDKRWKAEQLAHIHKMQKITHTPNAPCVQERCQLESFLRKHRFGVLSSDPRIRYHNVDIDIKALANEGAIYELPDAQTPLFASGFGAQAPRAAATSVSLLYAVPHSTQQQSAVDEDIRALWRDVGPGVPFRSRTPRSTVAADLEEQLIAHGLKPTQESRRKKNVCVRLL